MGIDPQSESIGYAVFYERQRQWKEGDRRIYNVLDLLITRLVADMDGMGAEFAPGLSRAIEVLTISRNAHA